jgi:CysZ protein
MELLNHSAQGIRGFSNGAELPFRGLVYLARRPRLWFLVLIPLVLNVILFALLLGWGFSEFAETLNGWLSGHQAWYWSALIWLANILFWLVVLLVVYFIFTPLALLIASPFNDRLAESVEKTHGFNVKDDRPVLKMIFGEAVYALKSEVKRLAVALAVFAVLLLFNLIPVFGPPIYTVVAFLWSCWAAALEFTGFAADRRHLALRRKWDLLRRSPAPVFGFGIVTVFFLMIPFLNVLVVPVSAVGGTMLFGMIERTACQRS